MAWPSEAGAVLCRVRRRRRTPKPPRVRPRPVFPRLIRYQSDARALYRVFNTAEYRFYRAQDRPPDQATDTPFGSNATLPHEPADTYADGVWYLSASYFNGVIESPFLPLGPRGETWIRLELVSGAVVNNPPAAPLDWRLVALAGGVVRVHAAYFETGALRADDWALTWTTDGSVPGTPPAVSPTATQAIPGSAVATLVYDLPAQGDGTTVRVRLQTRRLDSGYVYSEASRVRTLPADATGPTAAEALARWAGPIPAEL